jgi:hypothetical protein
MAGQVNFKTDSKPKKLLLPPPRGKQSLAPSQHEINGAKRGKNGGALPLPILAGEDSKTLA